MIGTRACGTYTYKNSVRSALLFLFCMSHRDFVSCPPPIPASVPSQGTRALGERDYCSGFDVLLPPDRMLRAEFDAMRRNICQIQKQHRQQQQQQRQQVHAPAALSMHALSGPSLQAKSVEILEEEFMALLAAHSKEKMLKNRKQSTQRQLSKREMAVVRGPSLA